MTVTSLHTSNLLKEQMTVLARVLAIARFSQVLAVVLPHVDVCLVFRDDRAHGSRHPNDVPTSVFHVGLQLEGGLTEEDGHGAAGAVHVPAEVAGIVEGSACSAKVA